MYQRQTAQLYEADYFFATGDTVLCDRIFEHVNYIIMHVVPWKHFTWSVWGYIPWKYFTSEFLENPEYTYLLNE